MYLHFLIIKSKNLSGEEIKYFDATFFESKNYCEINKD